MDKIEKLHLSTIKIYGGEIAADMSAEITKDIAIRYAQFVFSKTKDGVIMTWKDFFKEFLKII